MEETFTDVVTEEKKDFRVDKYRQPTHEEARTFTDGIVERKSILYDGVDTKDKVEHRYRLQGEEFDKAYTFYEKPETDHTDVLRKPTKVDKVTVDMKDIEQLEETEEQKYSKDFTTGRLVIKEMPKSKEMGRKQVKPKSDNLYATTIDDKLHVDDYEQISEEIEKITKDTKVNFLFSFSIFNL